MTAAAQALQLGKRLVVVGDASSCIERRLLEMVLL
jgi:nicotinamidase-related amidase